MSEIKDAIDHINSLSKCEFDAVLELIERDRPGARAELHKKLKEAIVTIKTLTRPAPISGVDEWGEFKVRLLADTAEELTELTYGKVTPHRFHDEALTILAKAFNELLDAHIDAAARGDK